MLKQSIRIAKLPVSAILKINLYDVTFINSMLT